MATEIVGACFVSKDAEGRVRFVGEVGVFYRIYNACIYLEEMEVPDCCPDPFMTGVESNNWSGTKSVMEKRLGRTLNNDELTVLSLSRKFGPTPTIRTEVEKEFWVKLLWGDKQNNKGLRMRWTDMADIMHDMYWDNLA